MKEPTFTIITVCFNEVQSIDKTLHSIVSQTCDDYELIVVDGGSTDGTVDVIRKYTDHISWWCSEQDRGTYHAMNKGVGHAVGEYVIFMNGGDCFYSPTVLEQIKNCLDGTDIIEGYCLKEENLRVLCYEEKDLALKLFGDNLSHQSTFIRRTLLTANPYDERYPVMSDWRFWLQELGKNHHTYKFVTINVAVMNMNGISSKRHDLMLQDRRAILTELYGDAAAQMLFYMNDRLVRYAYYLAQHHGVGYEIVRKIAKRVVKYLKKHNK